MSKELLLIVDTVANEKDVDKEIIFQAMEEAIAAATQKAMTGKPDIKVHINRKTGQYTAEQHFTVVGENDEIDNHHAQMYIDVALDKGYNVELGDIIKIPVEPVDFGRISAQSAKQTIYQKVRQAERKRMLDEYREKVGTILYGIVKRVTREFLIIDLGENAEGIIYRTELLPREVYRINDRIRACLKHIDEEQKGHQIILSRTANKMLEALFVLEVPEIAEEQMEIMTIARDPGSRAKIAVKSNDGRIDPVGACVGMRGSRVQAITNELNGEKIDIVTWDENPAQYVINALSPAEITSIVQDDENHSMEIAVKDEGLSQAIGKNGQNIRLATQLTKWQLNVLSESESEEKQQQELKNNIYSFMEKLDVEEDVATALVEEGFTSIEEIAFVDSDEIVGIEGFDEELAEELQARAKNALLTTAFIENQPEKDLLDMENMDKSLAAELASNDVLCREDLAELGIEELQDIVTIDDDRASQLILEARAPWFAEKNQYKE